MESQALAWQPLKWSMYVDERVAQLNDVVVAAPVCLFTKPQSLIKLKKEP